MTENRGPFRWFCTVVLTLISLASMASVALDSTGCCGNLSILTDDSHDGDSSSCCSDGLRGKTREMKDGNGCVWSYGLEENLSRATRSIQSGLVAELFDLLDNDFGFAFGYRFWTLVSSFRRYIL